MFIRSLNDCSYFQAFDLTTLCELLHPARDGIGLPYSIANAILKPGQESLPHLLKEASEVYFILEGQGIMHIDNESASVSPGQAIYIPPGSNQHIQNTGTIDLKILCIVHPMWRREDEVVSASSASESQVI
jgi:mannose-6-phosphate isomerase-like protein (cupin superfamily)